MLRRKSLSFAVATLILLATVAWPPAAFAAENDSAAVVAALESLRSSMEKNLGSLGSKLDKLLYSKWEYKVMNPNKLDTSSGQSQNDVDFTGLGRDGWELVGISLNVGFIFKRRQ